MFQTESVLRVRYAETDQMSVVYYGIYPQYFEVGRTEALRSLGFSYRSLEQRGIMLPVSRLEIKYIRPALYDDELRIETLIREMPRARITFHHQVFDPAGELVCTGMVELAFVDAASRRPRPCPEDLAEVLRPHFTDGNG